tara:strand:+ start:123 stop:692 length:570 start_codon:yes stop_codon:yes gene_type:complete
MKFEFIGNATGILIGSKNSRILFDPWIVNGVFEGSWCHYPPLKQTIDDLKIGKSSSKYSPTNIFSMNKYISEVLSKIKYSYESDPYPSIPILLENIQTAKDSMNNRMKNFEIKSKTNVYLNVEDNNIKILDSHYSSTKLFCKMDLRLLRRILDRKSFWNNAEIGCHIDFFREPNTYDYDAHTALQFFHL